MLRIVDIISCARFGNKSNNRAALLWFLHRHYKQKGPHLVDADPFLLTDPKPTAVGSRVCPTSANLGITYSCHASIKPMATWHRRSPCALCIASTDVLEMDEKNQTSCAETRPFNHLKMPCLAALVAASASCNGTIAFRYDCNCSAVSSPVFHGLVCGL